jgi:chromosome partitioning protein
MIILLGGDKGGSGKTTAAVNVAVERLWAKRDVLMVCGEKDGAASYWCQERSKTDLLQLTCVSLHGEGLGEQVLRLAPRFDDVVIDTAGHDSPELRSAMLVADLLVTPTKTSQFDYFKLAVTNSLLPAARALNPKLDAAILINCAPTNAGSREAMELRDIASEFAHYRLLDTIVYDRRAYRRVAEAGAAVRELVPRDEKAEMEMRRLAREVWAPRAPAPRLLEVA